MSDEHEGQEKVRQPASEAFQKYIFAILIVIVGAIGSGNYLMFGIFQELGELRGELAGYGQTQQFVIKRVDRLEKYHFSRMPKREEREYPSSSGIIKPSKTQLIIDRRLNKR